MEIILIFSWCLVYYLNSTLIPCEDYKMEPVVSCQLFSNCVILEGNEDNFLELKHIDKQIIEKSFIIPFEKEPILLRIINSVDKKKIQEKMICSLILNLKYYILCKSFDLIFYDQQTNYKEKLRLDTKIQYNEICDELYENEDESLSLFCLSQFNLKKYTLQLQGNVSLSLEHDVSAQIKNDCKKKQLKLNEDKYFIVFYQCSNWTIFLINNTQIITLSNYSMIQLEFQQSNFSYIDDITFSKYNENQYYFFLIQEASYLQLYFNEIELIPFVSQIKGEPSTVIQKILVQKEIRDIILVIYQENSIQDLNKTIGRSKITINQKYSNDHIYFHSNLILLQNQCELSVLITAHLNQTYQIFNTSLHFFEFDTIFCQYDIINKAIQFYRYYPLSHFIQPKQKYLHSIYLKELFENNPQRKCLRILYNNDTQEQNQKISLTINIINNCQSKLQSILSSDPIQSFQNSSIKIYINESNIISASIKNHQTFIDSCFSKISKFLFLGKIELRQIKVQEYISFQNETFFYLYDCKQSKLLITIDRQQFNVLEYNGIFYIVNKYNQQILRLIELNSGQQYHFNIKLEGSIMDAQMISKYVFLYIENIKLPMVLHKNPKQFLIKGYLSNLIYQPEPILFYSEFGNLQIIQYQDVLVILEEQKTRCFNFQQGLIISFQINKLYSNFYQLIVLHKLTQSISIQLCDKIDILQLKDYTFQDYQFIHPFKYKVTNKNLAILLEQNNSLYIAIFQFNFSSFELIKIIPTDESQFIFIENSLLYYYNKQWRSFFLDYFIFEIDQQTPRQNSLSTLVSKIIYSKQEEEQLEIQVLMINQCYKLIPLQNLFLIQIQQNQNLAFNSSDFFLGPINNLKLLSNSSINLYGPFLNKKLQECGSQTHTFCLKLYLINGEKYNTQLRIFQHKGNNILELYLTEKQKPHSQIFWAKQNYYIFFTQFKDQLFISLIECSDEFILKCQVISELNDQFQIHNIQFQNLQRTGNLIKLNNGQNQTFICITELNFTLIEIPGNIIEIFFIEKSKDLYVVLIGNDYDSTDLELIIYSINMTQKELIYSQMITQQLINEFNQINRYYEKFTTHLISSIKNEEIVDIQLLIVDKYYSYIFYLELDILKNSVKFELLKQIRNKHINDFRKDKFILNFIDNNILVFQQIQPSLYQFYDLRQDKQFYDYFYQSEQQMLVKSLNTTHFIFQNDSCFYLGTIGYEIKLENFDQFKYDLELLAQNEISKEKVYLQIHITKSNRDFKIIIVLIQSVCLLLIIIQIRNKKVRLVKPKKLAVFNSMSI